MSVTLEPYQQEAVEFLRTKKRAMVVAPAGSGKTVIAAASIDSVLRSKPRSRLVKIGWMANTKEQVDQARLALRKFASINSMAEVKLACAAAQTNWGDRDVLVVDEIHHLMSETWQRQASTCHGAVWGFTATPKTGDQDRYDQLRLFFKNEVYTIARHKTKDRLTTAKVFMLGDTDSKMRQRMDQKIKNIFKWRMKWMKDNHIEVNEGELWSRVAWQVCSRDGIMLNRARNDAVIKIANENKDIPTLILVNQVKHGEALKKKIPRAHLCHAKMGAKIRRETIAAFRTSSINCIIATSLADEGLDLPNAQLLILVSGGRSKAKAEQRTGRVLRVWKGKSGAQIYDFKDIQHPLLAKHSRIRQELYRTLGYAVYG